MSQKSKDLAGRGNNLSPLELVKQKVKISNKDVCKFLRVSDSTAVRYLNVLEEQGKIKQVGKTGRDYFYQLAG